MDSEAPFVRPDGAPDASADSSTLPIRILALDLGDRRIGVALTDPLGYTAQPLMTIYRKTPHADMKSIARLVRKHNIGEIVVGKPLHISGEAGPRAAKAEAFAEALRPAVAIPVHLIDERLTTWDADQLLDAAAGAKARSAADRRSRKQVIDQVAAVLILENFLQARQMQLARAANPPQAGR
jgi:putative Holliday junction resolvase